MGMQDVFQENTPSVRIFVFLQDSTSFLGKTGVAYNDVGLTAYYCRSGLAPVSITLAPLASSSAAWTSGGFIKLDDTNMPGLYRLDLPNEVIADGVTQAAVMIVGTGIFHEPHIITITTYDPNVPDPDIATILGYVDTEIAAIKAKTDQLTFTVANKVDTDAKTNVDAVKAKTDQLTFTTPNKVDTDAKTNVDAIKAKTDSLTFTTPLAVNAKLVASGMDNVPGYVP